MKYIVTCRRIYFAEVEADSEDAALLMAEMGLVPTEKWEDDDRPNEYSIECDSVDDDLGLDCDGNCFCCSRACADRVGTYCPD